MNVFVRLGDSVGAILKCSHLAVGVLTVNSALQRR